MDWNNSVRFLSGVHLALREYARLIGRHEDDLFRADHLRCATGNTDRRLSARRVCRHAAETHVYEHSQSQYPARISDLDSNLSRAGLRIDARVNVGDPRRESPAGISL